MADMIDRTILAVMGLEKKARELLDELVETGKKETGEAKEEGGDKGEGGAGLKPGESAQNKLVDDTVSVVNDLLGLLGECRDKLGKGATGAAESVVERLNVATRDDLDTVREMARVAREKVDKLEKKLKDLEKKEKKKS